MYTMYIVNISISLLYTVHTVYSASSKMYTVQSVHSELYPLQTVHSAYSELYILQTVHIVFTVHCLSCLLQVWPQARSCRILVLTWRGDPRARQESQLIDRSNKQEEKTSLEVCKQQHQHHLVVFKLLRKGYKKGKLSTFGG